MSRVTSKSVATPAEAADAPFHHPPEHLAAATPDSLTRYGPALCGVGMLAFAAALMVYLSVRLGWWQIPNEGDDASDFASPQTAQNASDATPSPNPSAATDVNDASGLAFGPLVGELLKPQPNPELHNQLANVLVVHGEYRLAARQYMALRKLYTQGPHAQVAARIDATRRLASCLSRAGSPGEAVGVLREEIAALSARQTPLELLRDYATATLAASQFTEALAALREMLTATNDTTLQNWARQQIWLTLIRTGQDQALLDGHRRQLALNPQHEESLWMVFVYHTRVRPDPAAAREPLEALLKLHPDQWPLRDGLLETLGRQGQIDEMIRLASEWSASAATLSGDGPKPWTYWSRVAEALARADRRPEARSLVYEHLVGRLTSPERLAGAARYIASELADPIGAAELYAKARAVNGLPIDQSETYRLEEAECRRRAGQTQQARELVNGLAQEALRPAVRLRAASLLQQLNTPAPIDQGPPVPKTSDKVPSPVSP